MYDSEWAAGLEINDGLLRYGIIRANTSSLTKESASYACIDRESHRRTDRKIPFLSLSLVV